MKAGYKSKRARRGDAERRDWVNNDENLYNWQKGSRQGMTQFVRANRMEIDQYIERKMNEQK